MYQISFAKSMTLPEMERFIFHFHPTVAEE